MQNVLPPPAIWTVHSSPVPEHVRNFIITNYGISPEANMYINYDEPNKVYVIYNGYLQYVDFASPSPCSPSVINNLSTNSPTMFTNQPVFTYAENIPPVQANLTPSVQYTNSLIQVAPLKPQPVAARPIEIAKPSLKSEVLHNRQIRLEKQVGISQQYPGKSDSAQLLQKAPQMFSSEWHKLTDSEREMIQRERRKANAYKTALCQSFKDTGNCEYGDECCFAHGENELRLPPQAHPKYKTQLCNKFSVSGYCPYGSRCQFIHQRPSDIMVSKSTQSSAKKPASNFLVPPLQSKNIAPLKSMDGKKPGADKSMCTVGKTVGSITLASAPKKKPSFSAATPGETAARLSPWVGLEDAKDFTPDVLQAQSTPLASKINSRKTELGTTLSKKKTDISNMLEKLFINDTDVSFSQSCFPRLSATSGWLSSVKSK